MGLADGEMDVQGVEVFATFCRDPILDTSSLDLVTIDLTEVGI